LVGVVKHIDSLGRLVIPKEIRKHLDVKNGDPVEIYILNRWEVVVRKHEEKPHCVICEIMLEEEVDAFSEYCGKKVCRSCVSNLLR